MPADVGGRHVGRIGKTVNEGLKSKRKGLPDLEGTLGAVTIDVNEEGTRGERVQRAFSSGTTSKLAAPCKN